MLRALALNSDWDFVVTEFERLNLLPAKCCLNIRTYKFAPELLLLLTSMIIVIFSEYTTLSYALSFVILISLNINNCSFF